MSPAAPPPFVLGIVGAAGRMGRQLLQVAAETPAVTQLRALVRAGDPAAGADLGVLCPPLAGRGRVVAAAEPFWPGLTAAIDFSAAAAAPAHARAAAAHGVALVCGVTGLSASDQHALDEAAATIPVLQAANMALGVHVLAGLVRQAAARLGPEWDIEIVEMHHRAKRDHPSGTALMLGRAAAAGRGQEPAAGEVTERPAGPRQSGTIGHASLRGGDVVGDHAVVLATAGELLTLAHRATDRSVFARGAVAAALWLARQGPGHHGLEVMLFGRPDPAG